MIVSKICLTGGPCGGKSEALRRLHNELTSLRILYYNNK